MPPNKKRKTNPRSLANLRNRRQSPQPENDVREPEPQKRIDLEGNKDESEVESPENEGFEIHVQMDSTKPVWDQETDDDESGEPEIVEDPALWSGAKLVRNGIWDIMLSAALNNEKSAHLHDEVLEDSPNDRDYVPRGYKPCIGATFRLFGFKILSSFQKRLERSTTWVRTSPRCPNEASNGTGRHGQHKQV